MMQRRSSWMGRALLAILAWSTPSFAAERVMINQASVEQLVAVPGIDVGLADAIVRLRDARKGIRNLEELRILPGMTEAALGSLREGTWVDFELPVGTTRRFTSADEVLAEFKGEPEVSEVQAWASAYAQVRPETVQGWLRAARGFAALPQLRVEYRIRDDWQNDFRVYDVNGNPPVTDDPGNENVLTDLDRGQDRTILVRGTWDLDRLVMSSEQIRVINEAQDVVKLREKVLGEVTRLYFERRRLQVDVLLDPKSDLIGQVRDELRLRELTASLDAYTGGRFSSALVPK